MRKKTPQARTSPKGDHPGRTVGGPKSTRRSEFLTIGCLYPMAGRGARYGHDSMIAAQMAADEINAAGGVLGREIRLLVADDRSDPTYAVRTAIRYVREDLVDFLMGVISSAVGLAVTEVSRQCQVIFVGTDHSSTRLTTEDFHPCYFRVSNNAMQSMRAGGIASSRRAWMTYLYIGPDYEYGHRQWREFRTFLTSLRPNVRFVGELWPKLFEPDYTPYIEAILRAQPDVLVHGLWGGDTIAFMEHGLRAELFERMPVVSFDAGGSYDVLEALGTRMPTGMVLGARHHNNFPLTPRNRAYVAAFHARAGRYPSYAAQGAYVGVRFIAQTVTRAGKLDTTEFIKAGEGASIACPKDREGFTSWIRPVDHQIVQEHVLGVPEPSGEFPPACYMLGRWEVVEADLLLSEPGEIEAARGR